MTFAVFQWFEKTSLSVAINESLWAFAVVEAVHLVALAVIGGAVLVVDLRLLGFIFQRQKVGDLAKVAHPWLVWSLLLLVLYRLSGRVYHPKVGEEPLQRSRRWSGGA